MLIHNNKITCYANSFVILYYHINTCYANTHIIEMVTSFMAVIDRAIPFIERQGMTKHNKGQSTLPKHIHKLIHKKRKLWKRLQRYPPTDPLTDCKFSDFAATRKAVKKAIYGFRCNELNKLADCKNKKQFYRYYKSPCKDKIVYSSTDLQ